MSTSSRTSTSTWIQNRSARSAKLKCSMATCGFARVLGFGLVEVGVAVEEQEAVPAAAA